jgi:hypothetical protein
LLSGGKKKKVKKKPVSSKGLMDFLSSLNDWFGESPLKSIHCLSSLNDWCGDPPWEWMHCWGRWFKFGELD